MKQYLIDFFKYNDWANKKLLESILQLPDKTEALKLFSHLMYSLNKWMNRITKKDEDSTLNWNGPEFPAEQVENMWDVSLKVWLDFLNANSESELEKEFIFKRPDNGKMYGVKIKDVVLQLNYHIIHHRAQIMRIIRQQGLTPPATDYIFTALIEK
jgi:uncharacterized damage-inducible protein DinB